MPIHQPADDEFPRVSSQPKSVDFLETRHMEFRNARGEVPYKFDANRQKFVARQIFPDAVFTASEDELKDSQLKVVATTDNLSKALLALKTKNTGDKRIANFDPNSSPNWKEITERIQVVVDDYHKKDTTWKSVRSKVRSVGNHASSLQSFVGLLPDGEYKTLCGGLTLILTAMGQHSEIREKMADLLQELPGVVTKCKQYQKLYPEQAGIQLRVNYIYINLLVALQQILEWYRQSTWKHVTDSVLKNSNYGKAIDQCVENIRQSKENFMEETHLYMAVCQKATLSITLDTNSQAYETNANLRRIDEHAVETKEHVVETKEHVVEIKEQVVQVNDCVNGLKMHLDDTIKNAVWNNDVLRLANELAERRISELKKQITKVAITPEQLMEALELHQLEHTHVAEIPLVLKEGLNCSARFQNLAGWVGSTTEFRNWLGGSSKSQILCVQGNGELENTSPLSFLISLLYEKLESTPGTLVLPFFCGLSRVRSGPTMMLRAYLVQLLMVCEARGLTGKDGLPVLSFLTHDEVSNMKDSCFKTYTKAVTRLLRAMREKYKGIFILIDAVDFYDSGWDDEMDGFMRSMKKLVRWFNKSNGENSGGVMKVLLTASAWSKHFSHPKGSFVVLDVPEEMDESMDGFEELE